MFNCSFCDDPISKGTGLTYAKKDGTVYRFCCSKCKKNMLVLRREGRRQNWTTAAKKFKESTRTRAKKADAPTEKTKEKPKKK
ncbi:MAG: 50S ribosomal protein L24e [Candidatus Micrarchaeota archaeon]